MVTVETLHDVPLFAKAPDDFLHWIVEHSCLIDLAEGELLFEEGMPATHFFVLLRGVLQITKQVGGRETVLITHQAGGFTGEVPLLSGTAFVASARALESSRFLQMEDEDFFHMLGMCTSIMHVLFNTMTSRVQGMENAVQQSEKLSGLGKMAAGLAHELNNPAAASTRAASQLREKIQQVSTSSQHLSQRLTEQQWQLLTQIAETFSVEPETIDDPIAQSEREDELTVWLDGHMIARGWELAPVLCDVGLTPEHLDPLVEQVGLAELEPALTWLEATLSVNDLLRTIQQGTARISDLVHAIKEYSYMDRATVQEIDIHEGIENTLTILHFRIKGGIQVVREYGEMVPHITASGSALNQVWTNLLDNAIDALEGHGQIRIRTWREGSFVCAEISDNGPGIPAEVRSRIFEPFFTTKGVGQGTGLGLDTSYRIIVNEHHGTIDVTSVPGDTRFHVCLPVKFV